MLETLRMQENEIRGLQEIAVLDTMNTIEDALHLLGIKAGITATGTAKVTGRLAMRVEAEAKARRGRSRRTTEDRLVER